jgi:hypothetical protein
MIDENSPTHLQGEFQIGWELSQVSVFAFFAFSCGHSIRVFGMMHCRFGLRLASGGDLGRLTG